MNDAVFDYRAYAPLQPPKLLPPAHQRPQLAWSQSDIPTPADELTQQLGRIRNSLVLIRQSFVEIGAILWRRLLKWCDTHIVQNLTCAWTLASIGWGGTVIGFVSNILILQYFTR